MEHHEEAAAASALTPGRGGLAEGEMRLCGKGTLGEGPALPHDGCHARENLL